MLHRFIDWLAFGSAPKVVPKIGERWIFTRKNKNPFDVSNYTVEVLDLKEGFIQYRSYPFGFISSLELDTFMQLYKKEENIEISNKL